MANYVSNSVITAYDNDVLCKNDAIIGDDMVVNEYRKDINDRCVPMSWFISFVGVIQYITGVWCDED